MNNSEKKIKVLYVDDESNNLLAFQASFRRIFEVHTASSAADGLRILNDTEVNVVICDQRMPQSTGVEFFQIVRKAFPGPIRMLLTGYTDAEAIVDAINKGEIYRYIKKPWDELELKNAIQNAYEIFTTRRQLRDKITELEKTNDELNRFVYSTSHDLRSPLASIMGILNLAHMENSVQDPNGYLNMIETCVKRMDGFIQKIIEYYKSIRVEDEYENIDFKAMLNEIVEICSMQNRNIQFNIGVDQETIFRGDAFRLSVIFNNLISNAVKYQKISEAAQWVKINVNVDEKKAIIVIEDNGIGIVEQYLNNIFKMFFRSTNDVTGLGIGLYIVKEALSRIGGEISVQSVYGEGTQFRLAIPNHPYVKIEE